LPDPLEEAAEPELLEVALLVAAAEPAEPYIILSTRIQKENLERTNGGRSGAGRALGLMSATRIQREKRKD
jgi:hypothetical protein